MPWCYSAMMETKATYGEPIAVEIRAELRSVKTCVDHTVNITLNLPEECLPQAKILLGWIGNELKVVLITGEK